MTKIFRSPDGLGLAVETSDGGFIHVERNLLGSWDLKGMFDEVPEDWDRLVREPCEPVSLEPEPEPPGQWTPGMFYDVGGAAALYWPDQHPEHPVPGQRWVVFDPWGSLEVITGRPPRDDAPIEREMGLAPFLHPPESET